MSRARIWLAAATLGLAAAPGARAFTSGQGGGTSPDEALWAEIVTLQQQPIEQQELSAGQEERLARRETLLQKAGLYLSLYPGGQRAVEAVRLELRVLFEIGCLQGGDLSRLRARCEQILARESSRPACHEAAYWLMLCKDADRDRTQDRDAERLGALARYVERYPDSRYTPRMSRALFEAARRRGDEAAMRSIVAQLERAHPDHLTTVQLAGHLRFRDAVGRPFPFEDLGEEVDDRPLPAVAGQVVLIVVWSSDAADLAVLAQVEAFRAEHPADVQALGVNVDSDRLAFQQGLAAAGVSWPQYRHALGIAGPLCERWGISRTPLVLLVDRSGRLAGAWSDGGWREAAVAALRGASD